ncbi:AmmeMemoRadiSam system protein A [bacterium]|nr:AmmeMemoRadiSam system protein A [bacterium]
MEEKQHNWYLSEDFHPFVKLAFASMYSFIADGKRLNAQALPSELDASLSEVRDELSQPSACFVSLKIAGQLRGCIGTIEPTMKSLAEEIIENAISASTRDPRFPPVQADELPRLSASVDVLSAPRQATEAELDPKKFGLIIEQGYRRGLLLPDLEGVDDVATQKRIVAQKGGIDLSQPHELYVFTVDRYY